MLRVAGSGAGGGGAVALTDVAVPASRALTATDIGKRMVCDCSAAGVVLTVPASLMTSVNSIFAVQIGAAGNVSWAGSGSVVNNPNNVTSADGVITGIQWVKADAGGTYTIVG